MEYYTSLSQNSVIAYFPYNIVEHSGKKPFILPKLGYYVSIIAIYSNVPNSTLYCSERRSLRIIMTI